MAETDVKRKLAAILAADVAGYSRLMGDDERATIATLREFREIFRKHIEPNGGRVVDMAGDSVLAVFDSAAGAVQAGIETQAELAERNEELTDERRMAFRIGINLGDIEQADDGTVYGDGVNVAARLEAMASPGGITVSGSVFDSVRAKLGVAFDYLGEHEVKNIAEPVRAYRVLGAGESAATSRKIPVAALAGIAALLIVVSGLAGWWLLRGEVPVVTEAEIALALPDGPTVVVLPFADADENATNTMFARGFSQEITHILTRYSEFFVISPETAQVWKAQNFSRSQMAENRDVLFVIEGVVSREGDTARLYVNIDDAVKNTRIWSEKYDFSVETHNIFDVHEELSGRIVNAIAGASSFLGQKELREIKRYRPDDMRSYECILLERAFWMLYTPDSHLEARTCLETATQNEPDYSSAWASLAFIYQAENEYGFNPIPASDPLERGFEAAQKAVEVDPDNYYAHYALGRAYYFMDDMKSFLREFDLAIKQNPHDSDLLAGFAIFLIWQGDLDRGYEYLQKAISLNPNHPDWYEIALVWYHIQKGTGNEAVAEADKITLEDWYWTQIARVAAYYVANETELAAKSLEKLLELYPNYSLSVFFEECALYNMESTMCVVVEEALRQTGLPETSATD